MGDGETEGVRERGREGGGRKEEGVDKPSPFSKQKS